MGKSRDPAQIHEAVLKVVFSSKTALTPQEIAKKTGNDVRTVKNHLRIAAVSDLVKIIPSELQEVAIVLRGERIPEKFKTYRRSEHETKGSVC